MTAPEESSGYDEMYGCFMDGELLLTMYQTEGRALRHDDQPVQELTRQIMTSLGGPEPQLVARDWSMHDPVEHLTLRLRLRDSGGRPPSDGHVKQAADTINRRVDQLKHPDGVNLLSATPNWLIRSAPFAPIDGPATLPAAAPAGRWSFTVPDGGSWPPADVAEQGQNSASTRGMAGAPDPRIVVAVLDTWPGEQRLEDAPASYPDNTLVIELADLARRELLVNVEPCTPPDDVPERLSHAAADHGLFLAGIIHSVAPHAELHLLHVLNDNGHGRADLMLEGLDYCLGLARSGRRVVVNLSLDVMIPRANELPDYWFGPSDGASTSQPDEQDSILEMLDRGSRWRIERLLDAGAVVIAAAGNDSLGRFPRLPPSAPATYPGTLCVVATDRAGKIASYSNGPNTLPGGSSIATFGGQGVASASGAVVPAGADPRDGVVGAYIWPGVLKGGSNRSGWVYWSGTSFATAVISGVAANVLARNELEFQANPHTARFASQQVVERLVGMAQPVRDPSLVCPYIHVSQQP